MKTIEETKIVNRTSKYISNIILDSAAHEERRKRRSLTID